MKRIVPATLTALALVFCATTVQAAASKPAQDADYDRLVRAAIAHYDLPGIAVGVIDHGKIVYKLTYGTQPSGKPIDADTLFELGSTTKAMTVTLLARLAEQGKFQWDDPVTKYLPSFGMSDPWVTRNMQVGDLVSHHSGLHEFAGDLMLWPHPSRFTPQDVVKGVRFLKPVYSFRAGYSYDNVLFVVAGQVAAAAGGAPYAELVRRNVFGPLGMSRCQIGTWDRDKVGNVARPHVLRHGHYVTVSAPGAIRDATVMDAAGGASCSLNDMMVWAKNWLAPTSKQLGWLPAAQRRKEWMPYTPVPVSKRRRAWNDTQFEANAHGWFLSDADGETTVWHTGVLEGMRAAIVLLPHRKSGFVVLINGGADDALTVLDEVLLKHFTSPGDTRPVASYADELARDEAREEAPVPDTSSRQSATPTNLKAQLGVWQDPWFGKVTICSQGDVVRFASQMSPLLTGQVMRVGKQYLVQWAHGDPDAWLLFPAQAGGTLHLSLVDRNADASSDFRDLAFTREGSCP
ncbi:MAG TPA: serine hydrolase domain-containing protein [Rhodanobacter sp.]|jgi:CubicO group peptidase (beta-lactamase class C family)|nr:serine hydrolase domain-containing protein [Rhodanobacter sp.]